jgi:carbon storage regulator
VLVLTRKGNQSIMIGDDIEVSVLAIMGEKVRIGIEAPRAVPIFRKEVYVEIQQDRDDGDGDADDGDGDAEEVDRELHRMGAPGQQSTARSRAGEPAASRPASPASRTSRS